MQHLARLGTKSALVQYICFLTLCLKYAHYSKTTPFSRLPVSGPGSCTIFYRSDAWN